MLRIEIDFEDEGRFTPESTHALIEALVAKLRDGEWPPPEHVRAMRMEGRKRTILID